MSNPHVDNNAASAISNQRIKDAQNARVQALIAAEQARVAEVVAAETRRKESLKGTDYDQSARIEVSAQALNTLAESQAAWKEHEAARWNIPVDASLASAAQPYADQGEMLADMSNPLYHSPLPAGEAFRAKVYARLSVSRGL